MDRKLAIGKVAKPVRVEPLRDKRGRIIERYSQYKDKLGHYAHLDHNDKKRRASYYARHGPSSDKNSAKYWAHKTLW